LGALGLLLSGAGRSDAGFVVQFKDSATSQTQTLTWNGSSRDADGNKFIHFTGTFDKNFTITGLTVSSNGPGDAGSGLLKVAAQTVKYNGKGTATLTISVTDTGFTLPGTVGSPFDLTSSIEGKVYKSLTKAADLSGNSLTFQSYADDGNHPFGETGKSVATPGAQKFAASGTLKEYPFSDLEDKSYPRKGAKYSLTDVTTITLKSGYSADFNGDTVAVDPAPAPASLVLLLTSAPGLGLGAWLRRRWRSA
jgi:hypothetical protein